MASTFKNGFTDEKPTHHRLIKRRGHARHDAGSRFVRDAARVNDVRGRLHERFVGRSRYRRSSNRPNGRSHVLGERTARGDAYGGVDIIAAVSDASVPRADHRERGYLAAI